VKLVAERQPGVTTETELACIERDAQAGLADLGLSLAEAKQLTAALQAEIVPTQVAAMGECPRACLACGRVGAQAGEQGIQPGAVPLVVRRRAGAVTGEWSNLLTPQPCPAMACCTPPAPGPDRPASLNPDPDPVPVPALGQGAVASPRLHAHTTAPLHGR